VGEVDPRGGSLALVELVNRHGSALVHDFQHEYGLSLPDVLFTWSPRVLLALVEELPDTSALAASLAGDKAFRGWGRDRHMVADLWDLTIAVGMAGSKKRPPTYPRPEARTASKGIGHLVQSLKREAVPGGG
jgi:hypothetical protein